MYLVAPYAGAWIETPPRLSHPAQNLASRPTRARGLKRADGGSSRPRLTRSRPTRARGLKRQPARCRTSPASRPTRARGLKRGVGGRGHRCWRVAPYAGAWIETSRLNRYLLSAHRSRPTRARGLKRPRSISATVGPSRRALRGRVD